MAGRSFGDYDDSGFGNSSQRSSGSNSRGDQGPSTYAQGEMAGRSFGDYDDSGFGNSSQRSSGSNSRGDQGPSTYAQGNEPPDYQTREQMAIRRMEDSSANSLRSLNETYRMAIDTTQELEVQAEKLDNVERKLDEIHVDLDTSKRNLRLIKSPFGGIANYFSKRKEGKEVTDPKDYKPPPKPSNPMRTKPKTSATKMDQYSSSGSKVVDGNLDEMSQQLDRLMGAGELISVQLDDSEVQVGRLKHKIDRDRDKMEHINRDIKKRI